jgi:hypothetical protein
MSDSTLWVLFVLNALAMVALIALVVRGVRRAHRADDVMTIDLADADPAAERLVDLTAEQPAAVDLREQVPVPREAGDRAVGQGVIGGAWLHGPEPRLP